MRQLGFWLVAALMLACGPAFAQTRPPVEAYGNLPAVSDVAISPNGERLAIAAFDGQRSVLRIVNVQTGAAERVSAVPDDTKLRGVGWADDERVLFYVSATINFAQATGVYWRQFGVRMRGRQNILEYWRVGVLSMRTGRAHYLTVDEDMNWMHVGQIDLTAPIEGDPGTGRMVTWGMDGKLGIYRIQLDNGRARGIAFGSTETREIVVNPTGQFGARVDVNDNTNEWGIYAYTSGPPRRLRNGVSEWGDAPGLMGLMRNGDIVTAERSDSDRMRLFAMNPETGAMEVLAENDRFDVSGVIRDPWTHEVVGAGWTEDMPQQAFFYDEFERVRQRIAARFPDTYGRTIHWSRDRQHFVVFAETNSDAGAYYLYNVASDNFRLIGRPYPDVSTPAALGSRQAISYPARDRTRIPAYLTLPDGEEASNLPLVLLVHGGPHARDNFTFDWWASFLASRGYAVLQPNYRGSTGYGYAWFDAGRGGWGDGVMQTDVEDGIDALVRAGIVDANRVCIVGASYGGYAALAGATLSPQRYRCAASIAGVSDLLMMLQDSEVAGRRSAPADWWRLSIGDRRNDRDRLQSISPANRAADVRAPILLMHGLDDTVVPVVQSRRMRDALQQSGKEVRYVEMPGDDHWLSNAATRTQMLRELEQFLEAHLNE